MYHCGNTGVKLTPDKSQHTKLLGRRKFSHRSCRDLNLQPFDCKSSALYYQAVLAPWLEQPKYMTACMNGAYNPLAARRCCFLLKMVSDRFSLSLNQLAWFKKTCTALGMYRKTDFLYLLWQRIGLCQALCPKCHMVSGTHRRIKLLKWLEKSAHIYACIHACTCTCVCVRIHILLHTLTELLTHSFTYTHRVLRRKLNRKAHCHLFSSVACDRWMVLRRKRKGHVVIYFLLSLVTGEWCWCAQCDARWSCGGDTQC